MSTDDHNPILSAAVGRWLLAFGLAYGLLHHQGFVLARLGTVAGSGTRWADWIDLATPYLVLAPAAGALASLRPTASGRIWIAFALGAVAYVEGHGIHLAANSVSNVAVDEGVTSRPLLDAVHLWDELVGHYLWYGGFSLVAATVVVAIRHHRLAGEPTGVVMSVLVSVLVGLTYATNALEGHFAWPGLVFAAVGTVGLLTERRNRRKAAGSGRDRVVAEFALPGFASAVLVLGFYGCWHRGFPDPSSVGWNLLAR